MQGIFTSGTWEERSDEISFADFRFSITHHYLVQESPDKEGKDEELEGMGFFWGRGEGSYLYNILRV